MKHVGMSRSATPTTRNEVTRRLKPPKDCRTRRRHGQTVANACGRLRTVANGCGRKSSVERTCLNPQTPKVKREPFATHLGKKFLNEGMEEGHCIQEPGVTCHLVPPMFRGFAPFPNPLQQPCRSRATRICNQTMPNAVQQRLQQSFLGHMRNHSTAICGHASPNTTARLLTFERTSVEYHRT